MRLSVNPNRMELLRLRRRLVLAERGHKLLKDKLEAIMRRFLLLMRRLFELQDSISAKMKKAFLSFAFVRTRSSHKELERLIPEGKLVLAPKKERIFNISIPQFEIEEKEISDYDFVKTESELDIGVKKIQEILEDLMEMSRLWKAVELLSHEIEITRRRVNALEHILIPSIKETVSYISSRLEEMERSYQVQLMRVKEIVRKH
ncbi:MAG: V-type ATP synthase subunit D [Candidatus Aminicenantes bacterium]|nr:MAG: V-type ATP synthase subunit D [Candidatus Aminicenantes bacterium]